MKPTYPDNDPFLIILNSKYYHYHATDLRGPQMLVLINILNTELRLIPRLLRLNTQPLVRSQHHCFILIMPLLSIVMLGYVDALNNFLRDLILTLL